VINTSDNVILRIQVLWGLTLGCCVLPGLSKDHGAFIFRVSNCLPSDVV